MLADSHVHLHAYQDAADLLARARTAGVALVVGVGIDLATSHQTVELARALPGVVAAVGFHPSRVREPLPDATLDELQTLAQDPTVGFIGEIGLDAVEARAPLDVQAAVFREQLGVARRAGRPINLHVRGAFEEAFSILREDASGVEAVIHYFVGDRALARQALDLGLCLSVGKPVTRAENQGLRAAIAEVPLDRLLLETDSYPVPGRTTEPRDVVLVARAVAELKGVTPDTIATATTSNLLRLIHRKALVGG